MENDRDNFLRAVVILSVLDREFQRVVDHDRNVVASIVVAAVAVDANRGNGVESENAVELGVQAKADEVGEGAKR